MSISLTQPTIGSTGWGGPVNTNFNDIQAAVNALETGTNSSTWQLDADASGPKLKNSSGVLEARNAADNAYSIARGATPVGANDLVTKTYADTMIGLPHSVLYHALGETGASRTYTLPADYLSVEGSGVEIDVCGTGDGSNVSLKWAGVDMLNSVGFAPVAGAPWVGKVTAIHEGTYLEILATLWSIDAGGVRDKFTRHRITPVFDAAAAILCESTTAGTPSLGGNGNVSNMLVRFIGALPGEALTENGDTSGPATPAAATCPTLMIHKTRGSNSGALHRLSSGATVSSIVGTNTFGAAETGTLDGKGLRANDWIEFGGAEYVLHTNGTSGHRVYTRPIGSTVNTTQVVDATGTASSLRRTGLHVVNTGATKVLCFVWADSSASPDFKLTWTTDGSSWTTTTVLSPAGTVLHLAATGVAQCRGVLYVPTNFNTTTIAVAVNVAGLSATAITGPLASASCAFATVLGRVYALTFATNSSVQRTLYEVVGGALSSVATMAGAGGDASTVGAGHPILFPIDTNKLFVGYIANVGGGTAGNARYRSAVATINTTTFAVTLGETQADVTLPTVMRAAAGVSYLMTWWQDHETDPTNPQTYLWYASSTSAAHSFAQFLGDGTLIAGSASGTDFTNYALPAGGDSAGNRISPDDVANLVEDTLSIAKNGSAAGRMTLTAKMQCQSGTFTAKVWISTATQGEGFSYSVATLAGTATGSGVTRVGNTVTGIADNVQWTVDVDFTAMSIADSAPVRLFVAYYPEV
jgi:hypothetical protein